MCVRNEKIKLIETNISKEKEFIKRMNTQLSTLHNKTYLNHYQIDTVTIDEILVASIHNFIKQLKITKMGIFLIVILMRSVSRMLI